MQTSFRKMCPAEPFRVFFPLSTLLGISGVSLWPLFFTGIHKFYPGMMHARLMVQGLLAGYILGFLGTALPRLLSAPALLAWELWGFVFLHLLAAGLHIGHQHLAGDIVFVVLLAAFGASMAWRAARRADAPPPPFALVGLGYLAALAGTLLWVLGSRGWVGGKAMMLGSFWLNQGFTLLAVLGAGAFLFPRFLGVEKRDDDAGAERSSLQSTGLLVGGVCILGSYAFDAANFQSSAGPWIRGLLIAAFALFVLPRPRSLQPVRLGIHLAMLAITLGTLLPLAWDGPRVAAYHVVFVAGFTLIAFTVATRVVLGHSGQGKAAQGSLPSLRAATVLIVAAAVLRVAFELHPARSSGLNWASYLWMLAAMIWGWCILPKVRIPDDTP